MSKNYRNPLTIWKDRKGAAFVEFALVGSIFILVTFAIIDFGRMMWLNNTVEHAATEGARYAAVRGSDKPSPATETQIVSFVQGRADGMALTTSEIDVTWTPNNNPGSTVRVQVTFNYEYIIASFLGFDPVDLQGSSTMVIN
jgi:Flp pilus assembly protein TadG